MLTSGYLAASPPEKLNVTFCVIQHTKGMRDINYWWYFWNCPWGHLSGPFRSPWFSEVQRFLSSRRVKEQCLHECLSPTHFWQIHAHKKDPEGTLIWPIIFHMYRLSDPSQVDICLHFYFQNRKTPISKEWDLIYGEERKLMDTTEKSLACKAN